MSVIPNSTRISKQFTVDDWEQLRDALLNDVYNEHSTIDCWNLAWKILQDRVESRFLNPIQWILEKNINMGEGFSAVAIQCILLEFFQALYMGKLYSTKQREKHYDFEYYSSEWIFGQFLKKQKPFKDYFNNREKVHSFYKNVRCGLLHEAATKGAVTIQKDHPNDLLVEFLNDNSDQMILYRSNLQKAIDQWFQQYKVELFEDSTLKVNFIRKMDDICGRKRVIYFAYGSNMSKERLINRISPYYRAYPAILNGYKFKYNKQSIDGSSKANIEKCNESNVHGICYEIDHEKFEQLKSIEKGYTSLYVQISEYNQARETAALTFISLDLSSAKPTESYRDIILEGAKEWEIDREYVTNNL
jgi:gamma-glutamylcyclotransferase (GGCT)/AIG2-like uncharacterized protein YtfP